jgi:oxalate decarboxylase
MRFLEMFKSSYYADLSLDQWMALTPPELLKAHLDLDERVTDMLRKQKAPIVPA